MSNTELLEGSALAAERKRNDELHAEILNRVGGLLAELMRIQTERDAAVTALKLITANAKLSGGEAVRSDDLLDDIHDALMECTSHDDGEAYPESKLITLGDAWAVLERHRKSSNNSGHLRTTAGRT